MQIQNSHGELLPGLPRLLQRPPYAAADLYGSPEYPAVTGSVRFYQTGAGVLVFAQAMGLPVSSGSCPDSIFAFHIHEGISCAGNAEDWFADARTHYNPKSCPHPSHAGDLPPLWGNHGTALAIFLTDRFSVDEIIGRTVIIHQKPDDFTTQPAGNAGRKIACGVIRRLAPVSGYRRSRNAVIPAFRKRGHFSV